MKGRVGWSACENMMSGVVIVDGNAGSLTARRSAATCSSAARRRRTGIDQKGGTVIVLGDAGSMTGFMMQRGRQIILGDVGPGLGDSMYDGTFYVGGKVKASASTASRASGPTPTPSSSSASSASTGSAPARAAEVRLRQGALQLRQPRALRAKAGAVMADETAPSQRGPRAIEIFTPEVINDIHMKAELGRYRMRGFSMFKKIRTGTSSCSCPAP